FSLESFLDILRDFSNSDTGRARPTQRVASSVPSTTTRLSAHKSVALLDSWPFCRETNSKLLCTQSVPPGGVLVGACPAWRPFFAIGLLAGQAATESRQ